jgi:hypothetical protein
MVMFYEQTSTEVNVRTAPRLWHNLDVLSDHWDLSKNVIFLLMVAHAGLENMPGLN